MTDETQLPVQVPVAATITPGANPPPATGQPAANAAHTMTAGLPNVGEALANLASFIPGFAGYKSAEERRISDKELRAVIGERLTGLKERLDAVTEQLSRAGSLDGLELIDQSGRRLEKLIDRMRFADYGYAAVFDRIQMGDTELAHLYAYDAALMQDVSAFDDAVSAVERSPGDPGQLRSALAKLDSVTAEYDRRFEARKHLFDSLPTA